MQKRAWLIQPNTQLCSQQRVVWTRHHSLLDCTVQTSISPIAQLIPGLIAQLVAQLVVSCERNLTVSERLNSPAYSWPRDRKQNTAEENTHRDPNSDCQHNTCNKLQQSRMLPVSSHGNKSQQSQTTCYCSAEGQQANTSVLWIIFIKFYKGW